MEACHTFVENYLKGRNICSKNPLQRSQEEITSLKQWLLERSILFKATTEAGFQKVCKNASLKVIKQDQIIYQQEDVVDCFYIILRGSVSLLFDPQFHAKAAARLNQMLTDPNGQKSLLGKMVASRKAPTKASLGPEVQALRPGSYFGQEGLLQKDEITSFSAVANEYTELLVIDSSTFKEVFLAHFEKDLYDKALYLVTLDLFSNWTPHLLRQLALSVKEVHHGNSQCLYRQGMSVSHILIIKSGSVKLSIGSNSKPTQELLDQIIPPRDYLSDILAETSIKIKRPFKNLAAGTSQSKLLSASPSVTSNTIHLRSQALLRHTMSAPLIRKQKTSPKSSEVSNSVVSFRLQEPRPQSTCQVCSLGPGDMLNHIEMLCKIKHSLFNAFSLSDVVMYEIDTFTFMQLLEKKPLHSLYSLIHQTSERVQVWKGRYPSIQVFQPLSDVLQQAGKCIPSGFNLRRTKFSAHSPEKLAYLTVKHLDKSKGFVVDDEMPKMQVELVDGASPVSETLIRKQFFIRQLTSKSLDDSYVHVCKAHVSFDAPLPKTVHQSMCSSDNLEEISPILKVDHNTDEKELVAAAFSKEKKKLPTSIFSIVNSSTAQSICKDMPKYKEYQQQEPKTQMPKQLKSLVNDQYLSNRLLMKNFSFIGKAVQEDVINDTNVFMSTTKSSFSNTRHLPGCRGWKVRRRNLFSQPPINLSLTERSYYT